MAILLHLLGVGLLCAILLILGGSAIFGELTVHYPHLSGETRMWMFIGAVCAGLGMLVLIAKMVGRTGNKS